MYMRQIIKQLCTDNATVYLEYALLLALVVLGGCAAIMPGSPLYTWLHHELMLRLFFVSAPIF